MPKPPLLTKQYMYEDELPETIDDETYDMWYNLSVVICGVRMGPDIEWLMESC